MGRSNSGIGRLPNHGSVVFGPATSVVSPKGPTSGSESAASRTSSFPVTTSAIRRVRYSWNKSIWREAWAIASSINVVLRSRKHTMAVCSESGGSWTRISLTSPSPMAGTGPGLAMRPRFSHSNNRNTNSVSAPVTTQPMRLLSMQVSRANIRRLLVRRAPPTFGNTIVPGGKMWAPSSRATSLDTELAALAISRLLPDRFISETFAKRTSPRTLPWAEIGKPAPLLNQPTRFSGTTPQCFGTSPSHSTPESL